MLFECRRLRLLRARLQSDAPVMSVRIFGYFLSPQTRIGTKIALLWGESNLLRVK